MTSISPRLEKCAEFVKGSFACDIGTDHALLPVYLIENKKCSKALACDIADGPLEAAAKTIMQSNLSNVIETIKSNGLENVSACGITDVIIAGMGGETICDILKNPKAQWVKNNVNLILQPMTKADFLRKWLCENGFFIEKEEAVCEGKFIYSVILAKFCGISTILTDCAALVGKIDLSLEPGKRYAQFQINRLENAACGLKSADMCEKADILTKISQKISCKLERKKMTISEIYDIINTLAPFDTQEGFDNSGLLVGSKNAEVSKILISLDITNETVDEANEIGAQLIISHHPVIFSPLKNLYANSVVYKLANGNIAAICAHTSLDMAKNGVNDAIYDLLKNPLKLKEKGEIFGKISPNKGYGNICELENPLDAQSLAKKLKEAFGCTVVRYVDNDKAIQKIAYCSGSGGSFLDAAVANGVDALITGDIKHSVWIDAKNNNISLFDCGHYHTERIILPYLKQLIENNTSGIEVLISRYDRDIVCYSF